MSLMVSLDLKLKNLERSTGSSMANTRRMNRLEELGRVDAEKAFTKKGARNLKDEKKRIVRELKANGGKVLKKVKPSQKGLKKLPTKVRNKMGYMKKGGRVGEMMYSRGYGEGMKSKRKPTELMDRGAMKKGGKVGKKKQGYKARKDESIAMRIKKKRTAKQLKASRDESYGKFGSKAKKSGKINR